jgi:hypothetical protein
MTLSLFSRTIRVKEVPTMAETPREVAAATIADAMSRLHLAERARLLSRLVAGVGVLALAVVSGGAFARYAAVARQSDFVVTLEDAARATRAQVYELVRYVQQSNPELIVRVRDELAWLLGAGPAHGATFA